jgi:hypothetical protein
VTLAIQPSEFDILVAPEWVWAQQKKAGRLPSAASVGSASECYSDQAVAKRKTLRVYNLINPCEPYTFLAPDKEIAALVCLVPGGQLSATLLTANGFGGSGSDDESEAVPFLAFFGADGIDLWFTNNFGRDAKAALQERSKEVGEAMLSMLWGDLRSREEYEGTLAFIDDPAKRQAFAVNWNGRRTSVCDLTVYFRAQGERFLAKWD